MMNKVNNLTEFVREVSNDANVFYRGHSDVRYKSTPGIYRGKRNTLIQFEHEMIRELVSNNVDEMNSHKTLFEKLTVMQHYGLPTRLLDITQNPLMALYFSVRGNNNKDGCVKVLEIPNSDIKYYDSDTVSVLSSMAYIDFGKFTEFDKDLKDNIVNNTSKDLKELKNRVKNNTRKKCISTFIDFYKGINNKKVKQQCLAILNKTSLLDYMVYEIQKEEKPSFRQIVKPEHFDNAIICVKPKMNNKRIIAQQGAFLLFGIKNADKMKIPTFVNSNIKEKDIVIASEAKKEILNQLDAVGINEQILFPEIENSAKYIKEKYTKEKR